MRFVQPISSEESTDPVIRIPQNSSRLSGAFFSPLSGDYAMVTGKNVLEVYDLREEVAKCKEKELLLIDYLIRGTFRARSGKLGSIEIQKEYYAWLWGLASST